MCLKKTRKKRHRLQNLLVHRLSARQAHVKPVEKEAVVLVIFFSLPPPPFFSLSFLHVLGPDPDRDLNLNATSLHQQLTWVSGGGSVVERRSRVRVPTGAAGELVFSMVNFLCSLISVFVPSLVTAVARKKIFKIKINPGHSAKGVGGRLQLSTHAFYVYLASNKVTL